MLYARYNISTIIRCPIKAIPTDHMNVSNEAFITVDEKAVYKFVRARANVVP